MKRKIGRKPDRRIPVQEKEPEPRRRALRVSLDEEDFNLLEKEAVAASRNNTWQAERLLRNAIRATWAYDFGAGRNVAAVASARDFFAGLRDLQAQALMEIERAGNAARNAAAEAATRCQQWLDSEKARRTGSASGSKVIEGKFRAAAEEPVS